MFCRFIAIIVLSIYVYFTAIFDDLMQVWIVQKSTVLVSLLQLLTNGIIVQINDV